MKAAGSEFRRIKKEHPGGVAAWLQEQNKQPTPSAKPKLRLGSLTRATDITKASRFPPLVLSSCFDEHGNRVAECPLKEVDNVMCLGSDCSSPWHTQPQKCIYYEYCCNMKKCNSTCTLVLYHVVCMRLVLSVFLTVYYVRCRIQQACFPCSQ